MRPSSSPFTNPSGLVDKRLSKAWITINEVVALLPQIAHVSYYLESLFNLDRNLTLLSDENVDHHILKDITIFQGASTYELALVDGFVGTPTEWLTSLVGPQGETGFLDEVAHQILINAIGANTTGLAAITVTLNNHISTYTNYLTKTEYNAYKGTIQAQLTQLEADILAAVPDLVPDLDEAAVTVLAQLVFDNAIYAVNGELAGYMTRADGLDVLLDGLRADVDGNYETYNEFVFSNNTTLGRVTVLEAVQDNHAASIIEVQTASADNATLMITLQAESATHFASIESIDSVFANQAVQINTLQVSNNANFSSIEEVSLAYVTADAAAATDRTLIRTQFAAADTATLSSAQTYANAQVASEVTVRSTAIAAETSARLALASTVNGHTSTLSTQASTIAGIDGRVAARYTLTLDVNGRISGFTSEDDGNVAEFEILADVFKISAPGGGARTEYSGGNWRVYDSSGTLRVRMGIW